MAEYSEAMSEISGYPKALSHAGAGGGGFTPAELVIDGTKFIVKATPDTIESVFLAVGEGMVIYRTIAGVEEGTTYTVFMGNFVGPTVAAQQFIYDETAGGYVYDSSLG